jgi:hypothetical protein
VISETQYLGGRNYCWFSYFYKNKDEENFALTQEILSAAVLSAALVIALIAGLPLGHMARHFHDTPPPNTTLPQNK